MEHLRYPNESAEYRAARNALLDAEIALRKQIEAVAAERRSLPLGGKVPEDYVFERIGHNSMPEKVKMSAPAADRAVPPFVDAGGLRLGVSSVTWPSTISPGRASRAANSISSRGRRRY
jgi:hypothetical protein